MTKKEIIFDHCNESDIKTGLDVFVIDSNGYDLFKGFVLSKNSKSFKILFPETNFIEDFSSFERIILPTQHNEEIYNKQEEIRKNHQNKNKKKQAPWNIRKKVKRPRLRFNPYFQPHENPQSDSSDSPPLFTDESGDEIIIYPDHKPQNTSKQQKQRMKNKENIKNKEFDNDKIQKDDDNKQQHEVLREQFTYIESQSEDTSSILPSSSISSISQEYQENIENQNDNHNDINNTQEKKVCENPSKITNFNISSYSSEYKTEGNQSKWSIHLIFDKP